MLLRILDEHPKVWTENIKKSPGIRSDFIRVYDVGALWSISVSELQFFFLYSSCYPHESSNDHKIRVCILIASTIRTIIRYIL